MKHTAPRLKEFYKTQVSKELMEKLGLAELTHDVKGNKMRGK